MKGLAALLLAAAASGGLGCSADCVRSADIQVTVVATAGVQLSQVARLHISMSVNDGPTRELDITPPTILSGSQTSFLLRPDPPPAPRYSLALTVEAFDQADQLLGIATGGGDALASGCNRFDARLAPLGFGGDGGVPDLGADMAECIGGLPDEDDDGRADTCDACPADPDPTPVDLDHDGLPDACDPDVNRFGNQLLYFEPFDSASAHWSGTYTVQPYPNGDYLDIDTAGTSLVVVGNSVDSLPSNVRAQTFLSFRRYWIPFQGVPVNADAGLFLGSADGRNGVLCAVTRDDQGGDALQLVFVQGGQATPLSPQPLTVQTQLVFRLRLTQRGGLYVCQADAPGQSGTTATAQATPLPEPVFLTLRARSAEVRFDSVVAESVVP